ncbi:hypothetical protein MgSA37_04111 [Mucilaginibacter gotjawali]|uniref:Uncharacterized protein n=2 Tax=Mucilaginibacter gotjawali TaxID=1550579 RepID=A0A839SJ06_9SPHI|nr:hypothetical protein [Mucilaginibacter gotjawali]BAU55919.1 hypothetical protein MgSA37_04111 [Mucilaginibacter gotjawali]
MDYIVDRNKITLSNGYSLDFEYTIKKTLVVDGVIVLLIEAPIKGGYNQNVFGITTSGDYLWRIQKKELFLMEKIVLMWVLS